MAVTTGVNGAGAAAPVANLPSPAGARLEGRRWRDPRLLAGVALVIASAVGTAWAVSAADDRVPVWAVDGDIAAGSPITVDDLEAVNVQVPDLAPYWSAREAVGGDLTATRDFAVGELLTHDGVAAGQADDVRIVTLPVLRNQMPADLDVGRRVDVYVVERGVSGEPDGAPELVLRNAIVAGVDDDSGTFGGTSLEIGVALSLPDDQVAKVLDAQARGTLTLVDVPVTSP